MPRGSKEKPSRKRAAKAKAAKRPARRLGAKAKAAGAKKRPASVAARRVGLVVVALAFAGGLWTSHALLELDRIVVERFEGRRFSVPSRVYAAPIVIYPGADWQRLDLRGVDIVAGHPEPGAQAGECQGQADIAEPDHANARALVRNSVEECLHHHGLSP